jgi:hypothetical protein
MPRDERLQRHAAKKVGNFFHENGCSSNQSGDEAVGSNARRNDECDMLNIHCGDCFQGIDGDCDGLV